MKQLPRITKTLPKECDPIRRLLAAVAVRAIRDHVDPPANLLPEERESAALFIQDQTGLIAELAGIREQQITSLLGDFHHEQTAISRG